MSVTALLVCHDGIRWLPQVLAEPAASYPAAVRAALDALGPAPVWLPYRNGLDEVAGIASVRPR